MIKKPSPTPYLDTRRKKESGKFPVKINIPYKGKKYLYPIGYDMTEKEFDQMLKGVPKFNAKKKELERKLGQAREALERMDIFDKERFEQYFREKAGTSDLRECFEDYKARLKKNGQAGNAEVYNTAIKNIESFREGLQLIDITVTFLEEYLAAMLARGMSVTTVAIYLRCLRAIIRIAIDNEKLDERLYPFSTPTKKVNRFSIPAPNERRYSDNILSQEQLTKLVSHDFPGKTRGKKRAVDMLEFIYGCGGANMADILSLTKENITTAYRDNGKPYQLLEFRRNKIRRTNKKGKLIQVLYTEKMQAIVKKYHKEGSEYLFPVLDGTETGDKRREKIVTHTKRINTMLKAACEELKFPNWKKITTYSIRHALASHLISENFSTAVVGALLGHENEGTTERYKGRLASSLIHQIALATQIEKRANISDWADNENDVN